MRIVPSRSASALNSLLSFVFQKTTKRLPLVCGLSIGIAITLPWIEAANVSRVQLRRFSRLADGGIDPNLHCAWATRRLGWQYQYAVAEIPAISRGGFYPDLAESLRDAGKGATKIAPNWMLVNQGTPSVKGAAPISTVEHGFGWPYPAFIAFQVFFVDGGAQVDAGSYLPRWTVDTSYSLRLVPSSVLINSLVNVLLISCVLSILNICRYVIFRMRFDNLCSCCGYNTAGLSRCPECGALMDLQERLPR